MRERGVENRTLLTWFLYSCMFTWRITLYLQFFKTVFPQRSLFEEIDMTDQDKEKTAASILIVEDESILAEDLGLSLENLGYLVRGKISTGEEAVKLAEELRPDLILMDIKLQGDIDGIEAAHQIRTRLDIPVVYLTGYVEEDIFDRAKRTEPYGYLGKPVTFLELRSTVETALHKHAADKKVRESEEKYRLLFSKEKDAISLTDASSQDFLDINEAFEELYGYRREEIIGMNATMVSAEPQKTRTTLLAATQPEGTIVPLRWHKTKNGKLFPVEISANAFTLKGRQVVCSIIRDISEREKAEEALRIARDELEQRVADRTKDLVAVTEALKASQSTLRLITDSLPVLINYVDSEQRYRFCNKTYELWRGVPREEIEGRHVKEVLGEAAYEVAREHVEAALSGSPVDYEMAATYQDGEERRLHVIYVPHLDETGKVKGFAGLITDITERKKIEEALRKSSDELEQRVIERTAEIAAVNEELKMEIARRKNTEEALRESEDLLRKAQKIARVGSWQLELTTNRLIWSDEVYRIFGMEPQEFSATYEGFLERVHSEDRAAVDAAYSGSLQEGREAYEIEHRIVNKSSGEIRHVHEKCQHVRDSTGRIIRSVGMVQDITERKRAEEASRRSEERFRRLIDQAADAIFVHDFKGKFLDVNQQAYTSLGYTRDELLSMTASDIDPDIVYRGDSAKFWSNLPATFEARHTRKDGTTFPVEIRLGPIEYGETRVVLAIVRDITDRTMAAKALQESEERFRTAFQTSPDAVNINRLSDGLYVDVNTGFTELTGFTRDEVMGKSSLEINIWHDPEDRKRLVAGLKERKHVTNLEAQFRRKDGRVRTGLMSARIIDLNGEPYILSVTRDVDDWKKAEVELREKTALLNSLIEALPDSIYFKDLNRRHLLVNKAHEDFFGVNGQEVIGKTIEQFVPSDQAKQSSDTDKAVIETKTPFVVEHSWVNRRGEKCIFETRKFPILDDQRNIIAVGGISRDITERKKAENQLKESLSEKEVLLREIHHRVKNNLAVIQSLLRIQSRHAQNAELTRMLEATQHRIRSMALAHELLYQSENLTDINISRYLGNLLNQLMASFSFIGKRIEIRKAIQEVQLGIDTAVPLGFILTELISNCYKHAFPKSKDGEIAVSVRCPGDKKLELVVKDDGVGIPEGMDFEESSSLGYQLIRIFVKQLNGEIEIFRQEGTEVRIIFPMR